MSSNKTNKGKWGEEIAVQYLNKKGFQILFRNWRAERGDIDIIALDGNCLTFVEVKAGTTELYGPPELKITKSKKKQLYKLASLFLQQANNYQVQTNSYRFDVVIIDGTPHKYKVRHYPNAFYL